MGGMQWISRSMDCDQSENRQDSKRQGVGVEGWWLLLRVNAVPGALLASATLLDNLEGRKEAKTTIDCQLCLMLCCSSPPARPPAQGQLRSANRKSGPRVTRSWGWRRCRRGASFCSPSSLHLHEQHTDTFFCESATVLLAHVSGCFWPCS